MIPGAARVSKRQTDPLPPLATSSGPSSWRSGAGVHVIPEPQLTEPEREMIDAAAILLGFYFSDTVTDHPSWRRRCESPLGQPEPPD